LSILWQENGAIKKSVVALWIKKKRKSDGSVNILSKISHGNINAHLKKSIQMGKKLMETQTLVKILRNTLK
jgi:hypothetical protein